MSFKDANGKYLPPISTGKKTENEAMEVAFKWLRDGIPQKNKALKVNDLTLKDVPRKIKTDAETEMLLAELKMLSKEKHRKSHGIHRRHCLIQSQAITLYWEKFFKGRLLGDITATDIDAFINYMGILARRPKDKRPKRPALCLPHCRSTSG